MKTLCVSEVLELELNERYIVLGRGTKKKKQRWVIHNFFVWVCYCYFMCVCVSFILRAIVYITQKLRVHSVVSDVSLIA